MASNAEGRSENERTPDRLKALVIDGDDLSVALSDTLDGAGFSVQRAYTQSQAKALLRSLRFDVVVSETTLPDGDGEAIFRDALPFLGSTPFVFVTRAPQVEQAVRLTKAGALDYIAKPYDVPSLARRIREVIDARRPPGRDAQPTRSPAMAHIREQLKKVAASPIGVLLVGEVGTGKRLLGRRLHQLSGRGAQPFVEIRCGSLVGFEADRLLFGETLTRRNEYDRDHIPGAVERAGAGTLFLDHIEDLPPPAQAKLIQLIDEKRFCRTGDAGDYLPFAARLVSSAGVNGAELRHKIHPDLLYRLAVVEISVPPLRFRQEDIEPLMADLMQQCASELGVEPLPFDGEALVAARQHDWPGNARELKARLLRALSLGNGKKVLVADMFPEINVATTAKPPARHLDEARAAAEKEQIVQTLVATDGRIGDAARLLGISRVTLWMKMKRLGLQHGAERMPEE